MSVHQPVAHGRRIRASEKSEREKWTERKYLPLCPRYQRREGLAGSSFTPKAPHPPGKLASVFLLLVLMFDAILQVDQAQRFLKSEATIQQGINYQVLVLAQDDTSCSGWPPRSQDASARGCGRRRTR